MVKTDSVLLSAAHYAVRLRILPSAAVNCCLFMPWPIRCAFVLAGGITWGTWSWGKAGCWAGGGGSTLIMCWRHFCHVAAHAGEGMP